MTTPKPGQPGWFLLIVCRQPQKWRTRCWSLGAGGRGCMQNRRKGYLTCAAHAPLERFARGLYFAGEYPELEGVERPPPGACRGCGCTDEQACPFGCAWVEEDLCSACVPPLLLDPLPKSGRPVAFPARGWRPTGGVRYEATR